MRTQGHIPLLEDKSNMRAARLAMDHQQALAGIRSTDIVWAAVQNLAGVGIHVVVYVEEVGVEVMGRPKVGIVESNNLDEGRS